MKPARVESVLVIVTRQIGDVLLTTPLIHAARQRWPEAAVDVLGFEGTLGMLRGNPDIRELIATPARLGWRGGLRLARRLWHRYDLALVAEGSDRAHLMGALASRHRAGLVPARGGSNSWKRRLLDHAVTLSGDLGEVHVVQEKLQLLAPWQAGALEAKLVAPPSQPLPTALAQRLARGYVVVHTPSMWPYKQWPLEHFRTLVGLLAAAGHQVVLTGGPAAEDRATVDAMRGAAPEDRLLDAGLLDFAQLAGLLRGAALYIGPDTSVSHLAAACAIPVLAIFGPTNPQRWAPWPAVPREQVVRWQRRSSVQSVGQVTLLQAELPCVPCGKAGCEDHRMSRTDCLPAIRPERVAQEALRILRAPAASQVPS
ncbi:glycosyltransferase family 9 protein [Ramlibacter sp. AN1133]|uniref:glycosyltransferase family 9 protein n=1 Tax=Ramlibacter sp. AN1133 TaxID=3133429 RepID=UPI0030BDCEA5